MLALRVQMTRTGKQQRQQQQRLTFMRRTVPQFVFDN
jgi:hypothetical protein